MGRVEKIIVLSVLFLVTLIMVVSLNTSENPGGFSSDPRIDQLMGSGAGSEGADAVAGPIAEGPFAPTSVGEEGAGALAQGARADGSDSLAVPDELPTELDLGPIRGERRDETAGGAEPDRLLSSTIDTDDQLTERAEEPGTEPVPDGSILVTTRGLEPSYLEEYRFYTMRPGDDFGSLAKRFYGDRRRSGLLRSVNEGAQSFVPGDTILVPVFAPEETGAERSERRGGVDPQGPGGDAVFHVVREGDSLWKVAKEYYGSGVRWKEIFEANRDQMASEDALFVGMKLRIP